MEQKFNSTDFIVYFVRLGDYYDMVTAFQISRGKRYKNNFDSRQIGIITTAGHIQEERG